MTTAPNYIFILGTGHSGGTLLNLLLGANPAVMSAGESLHLWNLRNLYREPDAVRSFWTQSLPLLSGSGWPLERLEKNAVLSADIELWRAWINIVQTIAPYPVIADKSNHQRIVQEICAAGLVTPYFVHLVRDPRAVVYSYAKKGARSLVVARNWQKSVSRINAFLDGRPNAMVLRYEDLVAEPLHHVRKILASAGYYFDMDLTSMIPSDIALRSLDDPIFSNMIYGGNRMRRSENREGQTVSHDTVFVNSTPPRQWLTATMVCARGLRQFGYPLSRSSVNWMLQ